MSKLRREIAITQPKIDLYGEINGDNDIIHYDHEYCIRRGFRGTLAHGPHLSALAADVAARKYGADWLTKGRLHTKWVGPVCPGDTLVVELDDDGMLTASVPQGVAVVGRAEIETR